MPVQTLKAAILLMDLPCSGLVAYSQEILTTRKSHKKKPKGLYPRDNSEMKKVLRFKYANWNVKGLGETKE
jgi:hypothetical protein